MSLNTRLYYLAAILLILPINASFALNITRGPYLQSMTKKEVIIVWYTDSASDTHVEYKRLKEDIWTEKSLNESVVRHEVQLTDLKNGRDYNYRIYGNNAALSDEFTFRTFRKKSTEKRIKFAVFGDSGNGSTEQCSIASLIEKFQPHFIIHTGDVVYDEGSDNDYNEHFFTPYQNWLPEIPFFPSIGNHDNINVNDYYAIFSLPQNDSKESYYSFANGNAHFISLNTDELFSPDSEQYIWLKDDLKETNKKWIIVFFHKPPFNSSTHGENEDVQEYLIPLFEKYKVDVVFSGHAHTYERIKKMNLTMQNKHKVLYIVTGGGGQGLYDLEKENSYTKSFHSKHHYLRVKITGDTLIIKSISIDDELLDRKKLTK